MFVHTPVILACALSSGVLAAPTPEKRAGGLASSIISLLKSNDVSQVQAALNDIDALPTPTSVEEAQSRLASAYSTASPTSYAEAAGHLVKQGLVGKNLNALFTGLQGFNPLTENSAVNFNPRSPPLPIYPKKNFADGTYGQSEFAMREQIYIPPGFTYGLKPPVVMVPGTGNRGANNFIGNLSPLISDQSWADPVFINPPQFQMADAQQNAETVAYAINYISGISRNKKVSIIGWSQGSESMQWAIKYWPSARNMVHKMIAISPDYHGTNIANLIGAGEITPLPPSISQQDYNSQFVKTLRDDGGDSAYVPTTNIYSALFDEIVEPQQGTAASGFLNDARGVGVTNNEVQNICADRPAGGFYSHESTLTNPLVFALIQDTLTNDGPGQPSRLNLDQVCSTIIHPRLVLQDFLTTEATIPLAGLELLVQQPHVVQEPAIRGYALKAPARFPFPTNASGYGGSG